ncbi:PREDICTED: uncharacterized protein LOC104711893 [Camelina sativa]|uniref:Uncharacterized protein LOC104711893 n=1 Tax=Camelina sativa TaxID=90675 RepID=A0ABM0TIN5_CAMSA|nr:PREDICTED: uncharacterized protein LOC104711893 [Camelina sativa]
MEDNETKKSEVEVEVDGLGLIDVASEDDSLLFSSFPDPNNFEFSVTDKDEKCLKDDKDLDFMRDTEYCDDEEEVLVSSIEEKEEVLQPHESPEPEKVMKKGKYNLRKSLAWDNAFFTNEGVLEPEEISSMMESNHKSGKKALPTIQEDVNRSTESISTFRSDCTVENSQEFVLFEDVRASIQRSAIASDAATPGKINELGATEVATSPNTGDVLASQEQTKPKASLRNQSARTQGLGKATKQPVAPKGLSTSISKPPNGLSKGRPLSTTSTNKASLDISKTKQEKNSKLPAGKEPLVPRIPISRRAKTVLPKPGVPVKSSLRPSVASKNEMTSSCSSLESCASASSSASHKPSLNPIKKKNESSSRSASQSLANRPTSRGIMGQPRISPHPTNKTTKSKLSSSVPSVGSISDCSSESSRASTTSNIANGNQKLVSGDKGPPANDNSVHTVKPLKNSKDASVAQADAKEGAKRVSASNGGSVPPTSMKPSGLRVPSPNIGFFDGARHGSASANKKSGKSQPARSPIQESSNAKTKASSKLVSAPSPKLPNKLYSKINAEDQLEG